MAAPCRKHGRGCSRDLYGAHPTGARSHPCPVQGSADPSAVLAQLFAEARFERVVAHECVCAKSGPSHSPCCESLCAFALPLSPAGLPGSTPAADLCPPIAVPWGGFSGSVGKNRLSTGSRRIARTGRSTSLWGAPPTPKSENSENSSNCETLQSSETSSTSRISKDSAWGS